MAPGARSNLSYPCSTWGLSEANELYWKSTCDVVGTFRLPTQSFGAPIVAWRLATYNVEFVAAIEESSWSSGETLLLLRRGSWIGLSIQVAQGDAALWLQHHIDSEPGELRSPCHLRYAPVHSVSSFIVLSVTGPKSGYYCLLLSSVKFILTLFAVMKLNTGCSFWTTFLKHNSLSCI